MNNEQKKEYTSPKMEILDCMFESPLLQDSCVGDGCVNVNFDNSEPLSE
ncbi:hypothetical protein SAMN05720759_101460 [Fibrobacter sp. UWB12]|nr:hypothetical protein SAMN05720759_101460 [Fibrobacter sp. UWB12]